MPLPSGQVELWRMMQQQHCRSIYAALDSNNFKAALQHCDTLLRNQQAATSHTLARALRALALLRLHRKSEADREAEAATATKDARSLSDLVVLGPLTFVLGRLGRHGQAADLLESASRANASDMELSRSAFEAHVTNQDYLKAQQAAARMQKIYGEKPTTASRAGKGKSSADASDCSSVRNRYFWWSIQTYLLLATVTPKAPGAALALTLAERMVEKHVATEEGQFDEKSDEDIGLYVRVLLEQAQKAPNQQSRAEKYQSALQLLTTEPGSSIAKRSLALGQMKRQLLKDMSSWAELQRDAGDLLEGGDRNWMTIEKWIEAATGAAQRDPSAAPAAVKWLEELSAKHGNRREYSLARLYLHQELRRVGQAQTTSCAYVELLADYFTRFSQKTCCFEDLVPLMDELSQQEAKLLSQQEHIRRCDVTASLDEHIPQFASEDTVITSVNAVKIRTRLTAPDSTSEAAQLRVVQRLLSTFYAALQCSAKVPKTVPRPATDLVLLAVQQVLALGTSSPSTLVLLLSILAHAAQASPASYAFKLLSLRLYLQLGCPSAAWGLWKELKVRGIQNESLGWLWTGHYIAGEESAEGSADNAAHPFHAWRRESERLYAEADTEGPSMMMQAFERGNYSTVNEFVSFSACLDRSLQRLHLQLESARTQTVAIAEADAGAGHARKSIADSALADVGSKLEQGVKVQWDYSVLPSFAHPSTPSLASLTSRSGTEQNGETQAKAALAMSALSLSAMAFVGDSSGDVEGGAVAIALPEPFASVIAASFPTQQEGQVATSEVRNADVVGEAEILFVRCMEAIREAKNLNGEAVHSTVSSLLGHVESFFASNPAPLPAQETHLVQLLLDVHQVLRARFPPTNDAQASSIRPSARGSIRTALQQIATTLRQRGPSSLTEPTSASRTELEAMLRATLEAQRGGLGAREKVVKDVKDEVGKRRKRLAQRITESLASA
ncbi:unnamed protein product [Parajaminaea phylloscopi]